MELDSRKNEAKNDLKRMDIQIEVCALSTGLRKFDTYSALHVPFIRTC